MSINVAQWLSNASGSDLTSIANKVYLGSFVEAYRPKSYLFDLALPIVDRRAAKGLKSIQFTMMGDLPRGEIFQPGDEMTGQQLVVEEGTITADDYLVVNHYLPKDQLNYSQLEIVAKLGMAHGARLRRDYDLRMFSIALQAARASAATKNSITIHNGGNTVTRAAVSGVVATAYPENSTGASNFYNDLITLARRMDEDNIPSEGRYIWITPYMRSVILRAGAELYSSDYVNVMIGNELQRREIKTIAGFKVMGFPTTTSTGGTFPDENLGGGSYVNFLPSKYRGNFGTGTSGGSTGIPVCLALCAGDAGQAAIGINEYEPITAESIYVPQRKAWFFSASGHIAMGQQHPWCAGSIEVTAS